MKPEDVAQEIATSEFYTDADTLTAAIAQALARVRAETIEECAKVAENNNSWPQEGEEIAAEIRALGGAR